MVLLVARAEDGIKNQAEVEPKVLFIESKNEAVGIPVPNYLAFSKVRNVEHVIRYTSYNRNTVEHRTPDEIRFL